VTDTAPACVQVSTDDAARTKALGGEIAEEERRLGELRRKSDGLAQAAAALEKQIEGAGGEKLRKQRALVAKLQEVGGPGACMMLISVLPACVRRSFVPSCPAGKSLDASWARCVHLKAARMELLCGLH
jgi:hypothetical protein